MYTRRLSFNERFFIATDRVTSPFCNQMIFEGTGKIIREQWINAVTLASRANPGSRVILKGMLSLSKWVDIGKSPRIRFIEGSEWSGDSDEGATFLQDHLDPFTGPTCEVIIISGDTTRIVFRTHHAVMDGRGTLHWAADIFRVLRGEKPLGSDSSITDYELAMKFTREGRYPPPQEFIAPMGTAVNGENGVRWKRKFLTGSFKNLLPRLAVQVAAESRRHAVGKVRLTIPVDLRQRQADLKSTGNLTNTIYIEIPVDATPCSVADEISWQIDNKYDCMIYHREMLMNYVPIKIIENKLKKIIKEKHAVGLYHNSGIISNLGKLDMEQFSGGGFNANSWFSVPPCQEIVPFFMVLAGTSGFVNLTAGMPRALASHGRLEEFIEKITHGLETAL